MNKKILVIRFILILPVFIACSIDVSTSSQGGATSVNTPTVIPVTFIMEPTTSIPTVTPTATIVPVAKTTNSVAFIAGDWKTDGPDSLWTVDLNSSIERKLLDDASQVSWYVDTTSRVAWSPDGQWIAVIRYGEVWIISPDGDKIIELLGNEGEKENSVFSIAWSPDSMKIAFVQNGLNLDRLGIIEIKTGQVIYPPYVPGEFYQLAWSPNSTKIAVASTRGETAFQITQISAEQAVPPQKFPYNCQGGSVEGISWSSQSDSLAFWDYGNGRYAEAAVCLISPDGQNNYLTSGLDRITLFWPDNDTKLHVIIRGIETKILSFDKTGQLTGQFNTHNLGRDIQISPDEQWLSGLSDNQFLLLNLAQSKLLTYSIDIPGELLSPAQPPNILNRFHNWTADSKGLVFMVGEYRTPDGVGTHQYGALYLLDIQSGKITKLTNEHWIKSYSVSSVSN